MQPSSILVLVLFGGGALAQTSRGDKKLEAAIEETCQQMTNVTEEQINLILTYKFNELSFNQKEFMYCYVKKTKMINDAGEIQVENIPFSTPEKLRVCKTKLGPLISRDHVVALALCLQNKKLPICEVLEKIE